MSLLVEILELVAMLAVLVGVGWAAALLVPVALAWPAGLVTFGVLLFAMSWLIDRRRSAR